MTAPTDIDLVTFDIFDTLVHRRVKAPVDVFELVRVKMYQTDFALHHDDVLRSFPVKRIEAERLSRERRQRDFGGEGEVTLDEIYQEFALLSGCCAELLDALRDAELALERKLLVCSPKGRAIFEQHRNAGRRIAFISDMYLPGEWLGEMLESCGYAEARALPIFVSGEVRLSKHTGAIYSHVQAQLGQSDVGRWLHVGDNLTADIHNAARHGLQPLHADWSQVDNRFVLAGPAHTDHTINSILGFLQTPQARQYCPTDPLEAIGYRTFGPLLFGFTCWLLARAKQERFDKMLFIARDGWLPQQLFDDCKALAGLGDLPTEYFYLSRRTANLTGIREWDTETNWYLVTGQVKKSVARCLKSANVEAGQQVRQLAAFGLEDYETPRGHGDHFRIKSLIDTLFTQSLSATAERRAELARYYDQAVGDAGKIAIVDIGWHGNIQKSLVHSASDPLLRDRVEGLYLGTLTASSRLADNGHRMMGWMCHRGHPGDTQHLLFSGGVELLEFAMTADHGSAIDLRRTAAGQIEPVLEDLTEAEADYRAKAMRVQSGIRKFCADYGFLLEVLQPQTLASTAWTKPFLRLVADPDPAEIAELASLTHSDAPGATDVRLPLASRQPAKIRLLKGRRRRARERAFWKAAFDKLNA